MGSERIVSLAAGTVLDADPPGTVDASPDDLRSSALMTRFPDPTDRARAVRAACEPLLASP